MNITLQFLLRPQVYKTKFQTLKKISFLAMGLLLGLSVFAQQPMSQSEKFKRLLGMLNDNYTSAIDSVKLTDAAIGKVLEELDPHSSYILAKDLKRTEEGLVGNFEGIGITFQILHDSILVLEVIPGGPSEKVGLKAGDKIVKIDDTIVSTWKVDNEMVVKHLRGQKGTKVNIEVVRKGQQNTLPLTITRDKIPIYSIEASYMADSTTGYIRLTRFSATTMTEFYQAVDKLRSQGMKDLIMDLQGNSGGYLMTAIQLCDEFLGEKDLIVYTEGAHAKKDEYFSDTKGVMKDGRVVVLVDESSASASEIFAGCMQDLDRGLIVGRRTFGKGLVQKPYGFPDGSVARITIAHYYTPSGRCIQRSYENGKKDYYDEFSRRLKSGELFGSDTVVFPDSLLFYTKHKRTVYGGGGIVPEFFIPIDTSMNSAFYQNIRGKGTLNNFTLDYADRNRSRFNKEFANSTDFVNRFNVTDDLLEELYRAGDRDSVKRDAAQMARSKPLLQNQVKALIARDLYDNTAFWMVTNQIQDAFRKGLSLMHSDKFDLLIPSKKEMKRVEKEQRKREKEKMEKAGERTELKAK